MQTKQEVLNDLIKNGKYTEHCVEAPLYEVLEAMEEYAKQKAIDFGRKLLKHAEICLNGEDFEWAFYEEETLVGQSTEEMYTKLMADE